jgi:putative phosphoribosyl transferase
MLFKDRKEAGIHLARQLQEYHRRSDAIVLALPRGGVPVAYEIATRLELPLDVFIVRKLGVPGQEELAMGAISSGGIRVLNEDIIRQLNISEQAIAAAAAQEQRELERRETLYRHNQPILNVTGKTVILIDDGLATGATMRAAAVSLRAMKAKEVIVAVPVAALSTCNDFQQFVDRIICAKTPEPFYGVGLWYEDFHQNTDQEVIEMLQKAAYENSSVH